MSQPTQPTAQPVLSPGQNSSCPNCGAPGLAPVGEQLLECSYCGTQYPRPQAPAANTLPPGSTITVTTQPTSTMAKISIVSAFLGWTFFPVVPAIVAVITGALALREIRAARGEMKGSWIATIGLVLGGLQLLIGVLLLVLLVIAAATGTSS